MHDPKLEVPIAAAAYARSASTNTESIEAQLLACRTAAARHGYSLSEESVYVDNGVSGRSTDRPGWLRMLRDAERDGGAPFQVLLVTDTTRVGRFEDPRGFGYWIVRLASYGVRVECTDGCRPNSDVGDAVGAHLTQAVDEHPRRATGRRSARGRQIARLRRAGHYVSAPAPYGFDLVPELGTPEGWREAARTGNWRLATATDGSVTVLQTIFDRLADGMSLRRLADELNGSGTPTPRGAACWTAARISRIVRNQVNAGDMVFARAAPDGDDLTIRGYVANPPVSRELFDQVQRRLRRS